MGKKRTIGIYKSKKPFWGGRLPIAYHEKGTLFNTKRVKVRKGKKR